MSSPKKFVSANTTLSLITAVALTFPFATVGVVSASAEPPAPTPPTVAAPVPVSTSTSNLDDATAAVLAQLQANTNVSAATKTQVDAAAKSLAETESLLPSLRQRVEQATVDAAKAEENYAVKKAEAVKLEGELKVKEDELAAAKKEADSAKSMVGAVARDMYMSGASTSEMNIVLSAKSPSDAIVKAEGAKIVSDTANAGLERETSQADEVAAAVEAVKTAQLAAARSDGEAVAHRAVADDRTRAAQEGEKQIVALVGEKAQIVSALQAALALSEASGATLQSQLATLQGLKAAAAAWANNTPATAVVPGETVSPVDCCPATASASPSAQAAAASALAGSAPSSSPTPAASTNPPAPVSAAPGTTVVSGDKTVAACPQTTLKTICEDAVAKAPTATAKRAILYAFANIGAPYSQANRLATKPNIFDCSSFVARAYDSAGAKIRKNGTVGNWLGTFGFTGMYTPGAYGGTNVTRVNSLAEMKPGDVIIQFNGADPSLSQGNNGHAQMYLGNNMVIQSGGGGDSTVNVAKHVNSFSNEWYFHYSE